MYLDGNTILLMFYLAWQQHYMVVYFSEVPPYLSMLSPTVHTLLCSTSPIHCWVLISCPVCENSHNPLSYPATLSAIQPLLSSIFLLYYVDLGILWCWWANSNLSKPTPLSADAAGLGDVWASITSFIALPICPFWGIKHQMSSLVSCLSSSWLAVDLDWTQYMPWCKVQTTCMCQGRSQ